MTCLRVLVRKHKAFPPASEVLLSFFSPVPSAQNTQDVHVVRQRFLYCTEHKY